MERKTILKASLDDRLVSGASSAGLEPQTSVSTAEKCSEEAIAPQRSVLALRGLTNGQSSNRFAARFFFRVAMIAVMEGQKRCRKGSGCKFKFQKCCSVMHITPLFPIVKVTLSFPFIQH